MQTLSPDPEPNVNSAADQAATAGYTAELVKQNRMLKTISAVLMLFVVLITGALAYNMLGQQPETTKLTDANTDIASPTASPITTTRPTTQAAVRESYTEDTGVKDQKRYVSPRKGVSFLYLTRPPQSNEVVQVKEVGNRIYLYSNNMSSYEDGQYLEIFQKDSNDTIEQALTKQFLSGKDPDKCFVKRGDFAPANSYPTTYIQSEITFPDDPEFDLESMTQKSEYCSADYARTNGQRYFLSDTKHPDKYLFFSIGQYGLNADSVKLWQDTVTFVD